ncbi:RNA polymerase, sigma-24 subunit, ECF subfamily (plasmid) [Burkholderia sp. YI23]|nr:RNA polymerase, sigma-24 subunit, ECF subfamily [Burkholderia sp. YI23]
MAGLARRHNVIPIVDAPDYVERADAVITCDDNTFDKAARSQVRALLERKVDGLPESVRVVSVMRSIEEMSVEETADCLNTPGTTVRSRHFRARSMVRESLAKDSISPSTMYLNVARTAARPPAMRPAILCVNAMAAIHVSTCATK